MDTAWFQEKISEAGTSQRQLAFKMEIDPSAMSRLLHGERKMTVQEAGQLAEQLGLRLAEVSQRAGIRVTRPKLEDMLSDLSSLTDNELKQLLAHAETESHRRKETKTQQKVLAEVRKKLASAGLRAEDLLR